MPRALVTGGNSGIGSATADLLAQRGVDVWITFGGRRELAEGVVDRCQKLGVEARMSQLDVRDPASIEELVAEVTAAWGELSIVINNAGMCPYTSPDDITIDEWDAVLETNARGTFLMTRAALPLLRAATGDRSVVNISSIAGQTGGYTTSVHYAASKAAILAITRSYARRLAGEGIRVNAVTPGPIDTSITDKLDPEVREQFGSGIPLGRFGRPEEAAPAIVLLAMPSTAAFASTESHAHLGVCTLPRCQRAVPTRLRR